MEALSGRPFRDALLAPGHAVPSLVVRNDRIASINAAARELLGESARAGAPVSEVFDSASRGKIDRATHSARPGLWEFNTAAEAEARPMFFLVVPTPEETLLVGMSVPLRSPTEMAGRLLEANCALTDALRDLSLQAAELRATSERLERLGALRDEFIAMLSHDLRAPLSAIKLQVSRLDGHRAADAARSTEAAAAIGRCADHILDLSNLLLDAAKLDAGTLALARSAISLRAVASAAVEMLTPVATRAQVTLAIAGDATVEGDRLRLYQIFANLIDNAIRHSPGGGTVTIELADNDEHALGAVRDEGAGVPPELRADIFERFSQHGHGGASGLGLYIVRRLVELHGGTIGVEDVHPGARFVFSLPRQSAGRSAAEMPSPPPTERAGMPRWPGAASEPIPGFIPSR